MQSCALRLCDQRIAGLELQHLVLDALNLLSLHLTELSVIINQSGHTILHLLIQLFQGIGVDHPLLQKLNLFLHLFDDKKRFRRHNDLLSLLLELIG